MKLHCSVLAEDAIRAAVQDWQKKHGVVTASAAKPKAASGDGPALVKMGVLKTGI